MKLSPVLRNFRRDLMAAGTAAAVLFAPLFTQAAVTGQWDFNNGDLAATVGQDMTYLDGAAGQTASQDQFGTTTSLGIPDLPDGPANVLKFPKCDQLMGYSAPTGVPANGPGGTGFAENWTLIMDLLYPEASSGKWRALIEIDLTFENEDAELFVNTANGIGTDGNYTGVVLPNTWHRIVFAKEGTTLRKYIDGEFVGQQILPSQTRWSFDPLGGSVGWFFTDNDNETEIGYVNSIQVRDEVLSDQEVRALAGPVAAGIPQQLPAVPSYIEQTIPRGEFAQKDTDIGFVINTGSTTIQDASISLKLDGAAVASPVISRNGALITVSKSESGFSAPSKHTVEVTYTDSVNGVQTASHTFDIVVFFEDFDGLVLGPPVDEGVPGTEVWTKTPPAGWTVDNSQMTPQNGAACSLEDPAVGVEEWEGWAFADWQWHVAGDDQTRSQFTKAKGAAAIADPDEWDDKGNPDGTCGYFYSFLVTPPISIAGLAENSAFIRFDSSWRPEAMDDAGPDGVTSNSQTATVTVSIDGGNPVEVLRWESTADSPYFHPDSQNETVILEIANPAGASQMVVTFGLTNAGNDWWWAFDNLIVNAGVKPPTIVQQPQPLEVTEGQPATFTVVAEGESLTYQWYKGTGAEKAAIDGATQAEFAIAAAAVSDAGVYSVEVTNPGGKATSNEVALSVLPDIGGVLLFGEDFEGLDLGASVEEQPGTPDVWTKTPPPGWTIDDSGMPGIGFPDADGMTEWAGWSFAARTWWVSVAGDQRRGEFTKGTGTVAIADPDEWDDNTHEAGTFNSFLSTPPISLNGIEANSVVLRFNSSFRPEGNQTATVTVAFDGGAATEVLRYQATSDDKTNETLDLALNNPAGAQTMVITFGMFDAGNNWFWAIDNIQVRGQQLPLFAEDFEGLTLGPNVEEGIITGSGGQQQSVWTKTPPTGWAIDDSGVPGVGTDQDGVTEWAGWSFANREWWAMTAGDQRRTEFVKGVGAVAIADSDEWDDVAHAAGNMATYLTTPAINIAGQEANTLLLRFDSSWRDENPQTVNITVSYDGGAPVEVLRWESVSDQPNFHDDNPNETVTVALRNPAGATSMRLTFGYFNTRNNWWWAIDNLEVFVGEPQGEDIVLAVGLEAGNVTITWSGGGTLQSADAVTGPWNDVHGAASPYSAAATGAAKFFRVKQ